MYLTEEQRCLLWLSAAKITPMHVTALAGTYGGAQGIWDAYGSPAARRFRRRRKGAFRASFPEPWMISSPAWSEERSSALSADERYPRQLGELDGAPYLLYYAGSLECLKGPWLRL